MSGWGRARGGWMVAWSLVCLAACVSGGPSVTEDEPESTEIAGGSGGASVAGAAGQSGGGAAGAAAKSGAALAGSAGTAGAGASNAGGKGGNVAGGNAGAPPSAGASSTGGAGQSGAAGAGPSAGSAGSAGQAAAGAGGATSGACDAVLAALHADFEAGKQGFSSSILDGVSASWPLDEWEWGTPTAGPSSCHGGAKCWGTNLAGNYAACGRAALKSGQFDLTACSGETIALSYFQWHAFLDYSVSGVAYSDGGVVEISGDGGQTWTNVSPGPGTVSINPAIGGAQCLKPNAFHVDGLTGFTGSSGGWVEVKIVIPPSQVTSKTSVRFAYGTGVNFNSTNATTTQAHKLPGWYIDDVALVRP